MHNAEFFWVLGDGCSCVKTKRTTVDSVDVVSIIIQEVEGVGKFTVCFCGETANDEDMIGNSGCVCIFHYFRDLFDFGSLAHQVKNALIATL